MTIDDCRWAVTDYHAALPRARAALGHQLDQLIGDAIAERFLVEGQLTTRWAWLDRNPGHPLFVEREEACMETLAQYVAWSDVLHEVCSALGRTGERCQ